MISERARSVPTRRRRSGSGGWGISTVIWAMGYRPDLGWVGLPILDTDGYPIQRRGVTSVPGLYILGLDWLHTARSGLFTGVGEDAAYLAAQIAERANAA